METGANVPLYGPYSKKYLGLSKIVPRAQAPGARFDLCLLYTSTVIKIVSYLVERGLVVEAGEGAAGVGRRPQLLAINCLLYTSRCV